MCRLTRSGAAAAVLAGVSALGTPVFAQSAVAPPGKGQQALAVGVTSKGIFARACRTSEGCVADGGTALKLPADVLPLLGRARVEAVPLAAGRQVVKIELDGPTQGERWIAIVAGPLASWTAQEPATLVSGWTGRMKGEHGEGRTSVVRVEPAAAAGEGGARAPGGAKRIVVGQQREDVTLCGRPALIAVRQIDPETLSLVPTRVDNLGEAERAAATRIVAERVPSVGAAPPGRGLLRVETATTGAPAASALTDGDPATAWAEEEDGDGRGELVRMSAASEVGITAFELRVRPVPPAEPRPADPPRTPSPASPPDEPRASHAPRTLLLATDKKLFHVTMPEDAWAHPGDAYAIKLPAEERTSCVALVLDTAYAPSGKAARVTISEIAARTAFDGATPEALVGALAGGGARSEAAAALLMRGGEAAAKAAADGYAKLDDDGKRLARGVIEAAECPLQVEFFAERITEKGEPGAHARDRMRRCGRVAAPLYAKMIASGPDAARIAAAAELSLLAPAESVPVILDALPSVKDATRRELRTSLAHAAKSERSWPAFARELEAERLAARPEVARIDLLRALGSSLPRVAGAPAALTSLATPEASFRTRYLLLAPAADLARAGDAAAERFVRDALRRDPDAHVRARAAETAVSVRSLGPDLVAAARDGEVRVREAAVRSLGHALAAAGAAPAGADAALLERLEDDAWTFVRAAAARGLGETPPTAATSAAHAPAHAPPAPHRPAPGRHPHRARGAVVHAPEVRARAEDEEESLDVRARAILALSQMCDRSSLDRWTKLARGAASPGSDKDQRLGAAAIAALGRVHPADLRARLLPLLEGKDVARGVRDMARAALATRETCR